MLNWLSNLTIKKCRTQTIYKSKGKVPRLLSMPKTRASLYLFGLRPNQNCANSSHRGTLFLLENLENWFTDSEPFLDQKKGREFHK